METLIPAPLRSIVYVFCIGCDMPSLERRFGEAEREEIFSRAAEYLRLDCGREEYLACVGRGMFALVCQCGSREAAQQRAEGLIRGLDGYLAGFAPNMPARSARASARCRKTPTAAPRLRSTTRARAVPTRSARKRPARSARAA